MSRALLALPFFPFDEFGVQVERKGHGLLVGSWPVEVVTKDSQGSCFGQASAILYTCAGRAADSEAFLSVRRWMVPGASPADSNALYAALADAVVSRLTYLLGHGTTPAGSRVALLEYPIKLSDERRGPRLDLSLAQLGGEIHERGLIGSPLGGVKMVAGGSMLVRPH